MVGRAFEILLKVVRSQWLKIEKFHITKEANWHFSFLNSLSNEVPQIQKQNQSAKHSQSATFGSSPAKQGRALNTSVLVRFVWNFKFRVYKYWIFLKTTCPHEIQSSQMPYCPSTIFMFFEHDQKIFRKLLIWSKAYSIIYTGLINSN